MNEIVADMLPVAGKARDLESVSSHWHSGNGEQAYLQCSMPMVFQSLHLDNLVVIHPEHR